MLNLGGPRDILLKAKENVCVYIFRDMIEISALNFTIPYSQMDDIRNLDGGKKLYAQSICRRCFWIIMEKDCTLTVLYYNDGIDVHPLILDLETI